jgi:Nuclear pore complex assembly
MLADLRITPDYPSKVLQALSLTDNPHPLIVKYVRTAKPMLTEPDDVDLYTLALAESCPSLLEAWQFQRTFPENDDTRSRLITKILDWCLSRT